MTNLRIWLTWFKEKWKEILANWETFYITIFINDKTDFPLHVFTYQSDNSKSNQNNYSNNNSVVKFLCAYKDMDND